VEACANSKRSREVFGDVAIQDFVDPLVGCQAGGLAGTSTPRFTTYLKQHHILTKEGYIEKLLLLKLVVAGLKAT
jgi:hypothetical protein